MKLPGEVKDLRQTGKAANFGFPGGMGAAKFVIAKRKGEGLRVCRVMGKEAQPCGTEMVTSWKDRETSPVLQAVRGGRRGAAPLLPGHLDGDARLLRLRHQPRRDERRGDARSF